MIREPGLNRVNSNLFFGLSLLTICLGKTLKLISIHIRDIGALLVFKKFPPNSLGFQKFLEVSNKKFLKSIQPIEGEGGSILGCNKGSSWKVSKRFKFHESFWKV